MGIFLMRISKYSQSIELRFCSLKIFSIVLMKSFSQLKHQSPADLGDLHRMGQTCPVKISFENTEDLGFWLKSSECCGMDDPRPIAFVDSSWISGSGFKLLLPALLPGSGWWVDIHGYSCSFPYPVESKSLISADGGLQAFELITISRGWPVENKTCLQKSPRGSIRFCSRTTAWRGTWVKWLFQ